MTNEPRKHTVEEYEQILRKNGSKTLYSHWDLFDFVYGGKKSAIVKAKYQDFYGADAVKEIEAEKAKIQQAIDDRVQHGWLKLLTA